MTVGKEKGGAAEDLQIKSKIDGIPPPSGSLFGVEQMNSDGFLNVW